MAPGERLTIAQVTPHPWGARHEVNAFVGRVSAELVERGHRVVIAAPSDSRREVRESRKAIAEAQERPASLFGRGAPKVLALGTGIPLPRGARPRAAPLPVDISKALEGLLGGVDFDLVHVHDPFAPSVASAALRHSRSLNVGSFHEPSERILSTQVARPLVEIFLGRLDARTSSCGATEELMERFFPGHYERVEPGADAGVEPWWPGAADADADERPTRIVFCLDEERGALRLFLRAIRRLDLAASDWEATVWVPDSTEVRISQRLRERVRVVRARESSAGALIAAADVLVAASGGPHPAPSLVREAIASKTVPVCSQIPLYSELTRDGEIGLLFLPGDAITLAGQLERLLASASLRRELVGKGRGAVREWPAVADQVEQIYTRIAARRHDPRGNPEIRRKIVAPAGDPRRPAHAHRSFLRLRDPCRDAARDRARGGPRGDRDHRSQRGIGRLRRARRSPMTSGSR